MPPHTSQLLCKLHVAAFIRRNITALSVGVTALLCRYTNTVASVQFGSVRFGSVQFSSVRFSSVQFGSVRFGSVQFSSVQFSSVQFSSAVHYTTRSELLLHTFDMSVSIPSSLLSQVSRLESGGRLALRCLRLDCWSIIHLSDPDHGGNKFFRNVCKGLQDFTAS
jgi:hypothetical protein